MSALSLTEANKLVEAANARAKAAEAEVRDRRDRVEVLEQELARRIRERDHFMVERDAARAQIDRELANLADVNAKLDAERTRNDSLAGDLQARRIELGQLRDELTRAKLEAIQLATQRKHVGEFLRDAITDATPDKQAV